MENIIDPVTDLLYGMELAVNHHRGLITVSKPSDQYTFWRRSLAGHKMPMHEGDIESGFYRRREKNGVDSAVAYWRDEHDQQRCALNGRSIQLDQAIENWTFVCDKPVSHADYEHRMKEGRWPNDNPVLTDLDTRGTDAPGIGHNLPQPDYSRTGIFATLGTAEAEAITILNRGPAKTKEAADHASDTANVLGEISKHIVEHHKTDKAPVLAEGRRIDAVWFPMRDKANDLKSKLKLRVVTPWQVQATREQEAALAAAQAEGADTTGLERKIKSGSLRRSTALKTIKSARIEDYDATLAHFAKHPEISELVQRLADRAVRAGISVPGTAVVETEQAV